MSLSLDECIRLLLTAKSPSSRSKGLSGIRALAEAGDSEAMFNLGVAYDKGVVVAKNYSTAISWYRKGAEKLEANSLHAVALHYYSIASKKNFKKAFDLCSKAARKNHNLALNMLGCMYENGEGVASNNTKAKACYLKAAKLGNSDAMNNYAWIVLNQSGAKSSEKELALKYLRKSASMGNRDAQQNLAYCYDVGLGFAESARWKKYWLQKSEQS